MPTDIEEAIARAHPASNLFPMLSDAELWDLAADIGNQGLLEPIVVDQGLILDGRNRWVACTRAGCDPWTVPWEGEGGSATAYVISKNVKRRHLEPAQRAAIAAEAEPMIAAELKEKERMRKEGVTLEKIPESLPTGNARDIVAKQFDVNPHYVQDAKRIRETDEDVFAGLKSGALSMTEAKRAAGGFMLSPAPEESEEQKAYYGLTRQRLVVRLEPGAVAEVCADPDLSLESFQELQGWLGRFNEALRARIERPIRVVQ